MHRVLVMMAVALAGLVVPVSTAGAQEDAAVAVNRQDGKSVFRLAFSVRRMMDGDVDATNAAVAYASCDDCRTVAASLQVVLAMGEVDSITPENLAVAVNNQCTSCETLAAAYQYVYGNGQPVRFTPEGNQRLADIRRRLQQLRQGDELTVEQLAAELDALGEEVGTVVYTELVPTGREGAPGQAAVEVDSSNTTTTTTTDRPADGSTNTPTGRDGEESTTAGGSSSTTSSSTSTTTTTTSAPSTTATTADDVTTSSTSS